MSGQRDDLAADQARHRPVAAAGFLGADVVDAAAQFVVEPAHDPDARQQSVVAMRDGDPRAAGLVGVDAHVVGALDQRAVLGVDLALVVIAEMTRVVLFEEQMVWCS